MPLFSTLNWVRDKQNPIFPPDPECEYASTSCMNPFIVRADDELRLYYGGGDKDGNRRICLAIAKFDAPTQFTRFGVVVDIGKAGGFDSRWCVLPNVIRIKDKWHLYYTGHDGTDHGLQSFPGIGLAISDDGYHFSKYSDKPVVTGDQISEFRSNRGIAGGSVIQVTINGKTCLRMYYTLAVGQPNSDVRIAHVKHCAVCHSYDGLHWTDHRIVMRPRPEVRSEDIAVATPVVHQQKDGSFHMLYCGIGSHWGGYSISEAESPDGYHWQRPEGRANVVLAPGEPNSWESEMVEYPSIYIEDGNCYLYYCGNGYGATGIGVAVHKMK